MLSSKFYSILHGGGKKVKPTIVSLEKNKVKKIQKKKR